MVQPFVPEAQGPTYSCLINANVEGVDKVFQEHTDKPEVETTDAPGAVDQDHDVRNGLGAAHKLISCRDERKENRATLKLN